MLKHNDATEYCITNGSEATVAGWQFILGPDHQIVLDTLFVKLKNPPQCIKLDGLPGNVVLLTRHSTSIMCSLPNDDEISISREQILVLPNFAMIDYASQGRTQPDNVVDLNRLTYYTIPVYPVVPVLLELLQFKVSNLGLLLEEHLVI